MRYFIAKVVGGVDVNMSIFFLKAKIHYCDVTCRLTTTKTNRLQAFDDTRDRTPTEVNVQRRYACSAPHQCASAISLFKIVDIVMLEN